jgi:predicted RNA-binding Zn-ribbon protein involved in translation (DUF1610 family)
MVHADLRCAEAKVALRSTQASQLSCPDQDKQQAGVQFADKYDLIHLTYGCVNIEHRVLNDRYREKSKMSQSVLSCPKCDAQMVSGYLIDRSHGATYVSQWAEGTPRSSWLVRMLTCGIALPKSGERIPISTFRCQSCGFLESYARHEESK